MGYLASSFCAVPFGCQELMNRKNCGFARHIWNLEFVLHVGTAKSVGARAGSCTVRRISVFMIPC